MREFFGNSVLLLLSLLAVILGCGLLVWGADRFVLGAAQMARNLKISPLVIGVLLVGFATSFPEMLVSAIAAIQGNPAVGIGNALGSNITNIGLALGLTALFKPLSVHATLLKREFPLLFGAIAFSFLLLIDHQLSRMDGVLLFAGFILVLGGIFFWHLYKTGQPNQVKHPIVVEQPLMSTKKAVFCWVLGLVLLLISARLFVWGAVNIAHWLGLSELTIGLTIVAVGTSLPEIAATITAAFKKQHDIAVGNVLGSNIFNLLAVMAMPGLFKPSQIDPAILWRDYSVLLLLTVLVFVLTRPWQKSGQISRPAGGVLLVIYGLYIGYLLIG